MFKRNSSSISARDRNHEQDRDRDQERKSDRFKIKHLRYEALSFAIVYNWFNEFTRGHTNLTDDLRDGPPSKATTEDDVSAVRLMIETDKSVTYQQIRTSLGVAISHVLKILHESLAVRQLCTLRLPHDLPTL
ncbi:hypothetical protein EVAR_92713_1 [Eumeta japonica]|uniref:Mos1 transposase HTH domain-containing protein n=1 Tax=Eumeta variegata TaxID=151549 RepID=A0A4C1SX79_EUMVA|nr:hypothetical protein EVAR_92713_1 [Eumeta japonica]